MGGVERERGRKMGRAERGYAVRGFRDGEEGEGRPEWPISAFYIPGDQTAGNRKLLYNSNKF